jgi:hypothetical protein
VLTVSSYYAAHATKIHHVVYTTDLVATSPPTASKPAINSQPEGLFKRHFPALNHLLIKFLELKVALVNSSVRRLCGVHAVKYETAYCCPDSVAWCAGLCIKILHNKQDTGGMQAESV